jgi:hypothetical protein
MPPSSINRTTSVKYDAQTHEDIKTMCTQMRNTDFRERIDAIEKFQVLCETETDVATSNIVPVNIKSDLTYFIDFLLTLLYFKRFLINLIYV